MVFEFNTTGIGRIVAEAGAEFVIFDMEHTGWSVETVRGLMATSRSADLVPMVRVPTTEYHFLARVLDVGAWASSRKNASFKTEHNTGPPCVCLWIGRGRAPNC